MKKLITIILILALILPATASAVTCVSGVYTLFIDADMYNRTYQANFNFDSAVFELVLMSDGKTAYYCKQMWENGIRTTTGYVECVFSSNSETFTITFPDGSSFNGYFDKQQNGVWICMGLNTYFRFSPVHVYDIIEDYTRK